MYIEIIVAACLMVAIWLDVYALFIRLSDVTQNRSEGLALANWVLYLARILNLASAFALAFVFESNKEVRFSELILLGFVLGFILLAAFVQFRSVEVLIHKLFGFVLFMPARSLWGAKFWRPIGHARVAHVLISLFICLFLNAAIFLPFVITKIMPQYRMSAVYMGQFMNFASTLLLMLYADPVMMRGRDTQILAAGMDGFIWGRFVANALVILFFVVWVGYWSWK